MSRIFPQTERNHASPPLKKAPTVPVIPSATKSPRRRWLGIGAGLVLVMIAGLGCYLLAVAWPQTERREAYLPQLEAQAKRDPYDSALLALLGGRLMEAHEFPAAADRLEHAYASGETSDSIFLCLAAIKAAMGDPQSAAYLHVGADKTDARPLREAVYRVAHLPQNAPPLTIAAAISPQGARPVVAAYTRGSILNGFAEWMGRRNPEKSGFATRQSWAAAQPDDPEAQRLWGLALCKNRRFADAEGVIQRAITLAPNNPDLYRTLGQIEDGLGDPAQAAVAYIACLKQRRDDLPSLLGMGMDALEVQMPQSSIRVFQNATRVAPTSADAWIGLGRADMAGRRNYDAALGAFETAARLAPGRADFADDYASALLQNGRWDEAEAMLRRALALNSQDSVALSLLGTVLTDYNATPARLNEALDALEKAANIAPPVAAPAVRLQLAVVLLRVERVPEAVENLEKVIAQEPANDRALLTLSHAYQRAGQSAKSEQAAKRAAEVTAGADQIKVLSGRSLAHPADTTLHLQMAELYQRMGLTAKAQQERQIITVLRTSPPLGKASSTQTLQDMIDGALSKQ